MTETRGHIKKILKRTLPLELQSYLTRRPSVGIDRASWDREYAAGEWSKLGNLDEMPRYALIAGYTRNIGSGASVLDVGCGEGHLASWLLEDGKRRYFGIDLSSVAIQKARGRASNGARFEVADAGTFYTEERFDIIVLNEVLYYIEQPEQALERYTDLLAPGGVLIISMYRVPESISVWRRVVSQVDVIDKVWLRGSSRTEWDVWLCRPAQCSNCG